MFFMVFVNQLEFIYVDIIVSSWFLNVNFYNADSDGKFKIENWALPSKQKFRKSRTDFWALGFEQAKSGWIEIQIKKLASS